MFYFIGTLKKTLEKTKEFWAFGGLKIYLLVKTGVMCLFVIPGLELSHFEILIALCKVKNVSYKLPAAEVPRQELRQLHEINF